MGLRVNTLAGANRMNQARLALMKALVLSQDSDSRMHIEQGIMSIDKWFVRQCEMIGPVEVGGEQAARLLELQRREGVRHGDTGGG